MIGTVPTGMFVPLTLIGAWSADEHLTGEMKKQIIDSADPRVYDGNTNRRPNPDLQNIQSENSSQKSKAE